ncbi:hypothetical protein MNV49_005749 [Pseudohyphozyma bogoriensis]|nr:hypothetical protein MNV49_005749 [Pseudohyphozyma bogoriensis]
MEWRRSARQQERLQKKREESQQREQEEQKRADRESAPLRAFEEEQRKVRAVMAKKLGYDPGRPRGNNPSAPATVVPLLPTSPPKILPSLPVNEQPDTTTITETARNPSQSTATLKTQRDGDKDFCRLHMPGHAVAVSLETLLNVSGGEDMVGKFAELETKATGLREDKALKRLVENGYAEESVTGDEPRHPQNSKIDGTYWLAALASRAFPQEEPRVYHLDYQGQPTKDLPSEGDYQHKRRYDAMLLAVGSHRQTISNCLVNIEYASATAPSTEFNPFVGSSSGYTKSQQTIKNSDDILSVQSTRTHVLSLSFHGRAFLKGDAKKADRKSSRVLLQVFMLTPERVDVALIEDCFGDGINRLAALLETLRTASIYQLGLCPLIDYSLTDGKLGKITPKALHLPPTPNNSGPSTPTINLLADMRLSSPRCRPFGRSTLVLAGRIEELQTDVVAKFAHIADTRPWREVDMSECLFSDPTDLPSYAVEAIYSYASPRRLPAIRPAATASVDEGQGTLRSEPPQSQGKAVAIVPRHLEVVVFDSPHDAVPIAKAKSADDFIDVLIRLFEAILDAFIRGVMHGDVSSPNVLVTIDGKLRFIDWEVARRFGAPATEGTVTGTLDTMSISRLFLNPTGLPHDDVESAIYVAIKVLTMSFRPRAINAQAWGTYLEGLKWNDPTISPYDLAEKRTLMWSIASRNNRTRLALNMMLEEDPVRAKLIEILLETQVPDRSTDLASSIQGLSEEERYGPAKKDLGELVRDLVQKLREVKKDAGAMKWVVRS